MTPWRRLRAHAVALIFAAAVAAPSSAFAQTEVSLAAPAVQNQLDAQLIKLVGEKVTQSRALQVAIVQNGRLVYSRAFGSATLDTRFPIASVTKMFTAVAVMQLVQAGRVDLNAKVSTYLQTVPHGDRITVQELLVHTSGLWDYGDYAFQTGLTARPTTPTAILGMVAKHPLTSPPGTKWTYSNTGYVVLGLIVEHVAKQSLAQYERDHIFQPAGMTETTMGNPPDGVPQAKGYLSASGAQANAYDPSWTFACGDIVSTATDLARFDIALLGGELLSPKVFALMQTDVIPSDIGMQGLGVFVITLRGLHIVGHHGGVPGYEGDNETIPTRQLAWIVLSNAFDFPTSRANAIVINAFFPGLLRAPTVTVGLEDPMVTARFRNALESLLQGAVERSQYTDEADTALTPQLLAKTAAQLKPLGEVDKIVFVGVAKASFGTMYTYNVAFHGGQTLTWRFILDANGKIAGIGVI